MIWRYLVGLAWRAAPRTVAAAFVTTTLAAAASASFPLGFHLMVDGSLEHDAGRVVLGGVVVVVLFTLGWLLATLAVGRNSVLTDQINAYLSERIAYLVNAAPRLSHLEDPELLTEIDQLRTHRRTLAAAVRLLLRGWTVVIRGGVIMVLLASVYPPVMIVPLLGLIPALADRRANRARQRTDDALATERRLAGDLFTLATTAATAKELRTYGVTAALTERHAELSERVRRRAVGGAVRSALWEAAGWLGYAAAFVGVILVLVLRAAHGDTTPGEVVMAVSLMRRAQVQVSNASDTAGSLATALRTSRRLHWLETYVEEETARAGADPVPTRLTDGITLQGVTFGYAAEPVLRDLTLELPAGSVVAIVGENGAGKTTLVKLLTGMYRPDAGRILVDGTDLADLPPHEWRRRTTAVFQDFLRPQLELREAVGIGDLDHLDDEERVRAAMGKAGAELRLELGTPLGRWFSGGRELSGGQWQRIALARALMRSPQEPLLTVLDEPTASLDAAAETRLFARFAALSRESAGTGGITILVSHRFSTVRMADLIVVLADGQVAEAGAHEDLLAAGGPYAQLFHLQAQAYR